MADFISFGSLILIKFQADSKLSSAILQAFNLSYKAETLAIKGGGWHGVECLNTIFVVVLGGGWRN